MTTIICDVCKKSIPNARRDYTYQSVLDKSICNPCHSKVLSTVKGKMDKHSTYTLKGYKKTMTETVHKLG